MRPSASRTVVFLGGVAIAAVAMWSWRHARRLEAPRSYAPRPSTFENLARLSPGNPQVEELIERIRTRPSTGR